jgi:hypothetical protein
MLLALVLLVWPIIPAALQKMASKMQIKVA